MNAEAIPEGLEAVLTEYVFSKWDQSFLMTPAGEKGKRDVLINRYQQSLQFTVPWLKRVLNLESAQVVEVGCGTGSSTVALAQNCRKLIGFDIDHDSVEAAIGRCRVYGVENATLAAVAPTELLSHVSQYADSTDAYILYAVLEHQTYQERLETLSTLWGHLKPGGALVIVETPNRLAYIDKHTSEMPFYHLLPDELALRYLDKVPRVAFREDMSRTMKDPNGDPSEKRIRWGIGASYHEFEIALGDKLDEILAADGFESEIVNWFGTDLDEELLTRFFVERVPNVPIGFSRAVLNLVLVKPTSEAERRSNAAAWATRRQEIAARYGRPAPADSWPKPSPSAYPATVNIPIPPALRPSVERVRQRFWQAVGTVREALRR